MIKVSRPNDCRLLVGNTGTADLGPLVALTNRTSTGSMLAAVMISKGSDVPDSELKVKEMAEMDRMLVSSLSDRPREIRPDLRSGT